MNYLNTLYYHEIFQIKFPPRNQLSSHILIPGTDCSPNREKSDAQSSEAYHHEIISIVVG